ncbi:hypothetical protein [Streptomyces sp. NBC_01006]|uniref:hypothetical protein n=1 Tax=Streptomyces sp. NBC_01006 TaxID=2903716 RepID=UPI0038701009|nr:hypothetical protein OG509_17840 [Streptomyces sp. NBC_01006]
MAGPRPDVEACDAAHRDYLRSPSPSGTLLEAIGPETRLSAGRAQPERRFAAGCTGVTRLHGELVAEHARVT